MLKGYILKHKASYLTGILILFMVDLISLKIPQYTGEITDGLKEGGMNFQGVLAIIGCILLTGAGMAFGRFGWRYFIFGSARKVEYELRNDLFSHLTKLSMRFYNENKTGDLMAHFTNDLGAVRIAIGPAVIAGFDAVIMTLMVIVKMMLYVDIRLTLLACIPMLFILFGGITYGRAMEKRFSEKQKAFADLTDQVQESISGVRVIKAFVQEEKEIIAFSKLNQNNKEKNLKVVKLQAIMMPLLDVIIGISSVITLFYGGYLVVKGELSAGRFVAFNQYVGMLVWPMLAVGDSITAISQGRASIRRIERIFKEQSEIVEAVPDSSIQSICGKIELNHLTFRFLPEFPTVLKDVSVTVEPGTTLAILGKTGSGKTAICNLLLRMYNTEPGMIKIDGENIQNIPLKLLRDSIAYVPQDNFLFSDTIQTNIAFGVRDLIDLPEKEESLMKNFFSISRHKQEYQERTLMQRESKTDQIYNDLKQVQEASEMACIHENIMNFPRQYATMVGERGVTVSGGQKQRTSIARAILKDAPILILDDALSAVDTNTEERILENLKNNREGKTTILIAHRISTIQNADKILVLEEGACAEYGTHEELLELGGIYARLYEKQQLEKQLEAC